MTRLIAWVVPDLIAPTKWDTLLIALDAACHEMLVLLYSGLRKMVGPVRGTMTDREATVIAALIVAGRRFPR